jgi:hypothetical protein
VRVRRPVKSCLRSSRPEAEKSNNYVAELRKMMHSSVVEYDYPCGGPVSVNRCQEYAIPAGQNPVGGACSILVTAEKRAPRGPNLFKRCRCNARLQSRALGSIPVTGYESSTASAEKESPPGPQSLQKSRCNALAAGLQIERLEIDASGRVSIVVKNSAGGPVPADEVESWLSKQPKGQNANSR